MAFNNYRKRRKPNGPSKNELRSARHEKNDLSRMHAGTPRQKFPGVSGLRLDIRMEGSSGIPLGEETIAIGLDEPLDLQIACPSTCGNGQFNLLDALTDAVQSSKEVAASFLLCQSPSYMDARIACGTKLHYRFTITYQEKQSA